LPTSEPPSARRAGSRLLVYRRRGRPDGVEVLGEAAEHPVRREAAYVQQRRGRARGGEQVWRHEHFVIEAEDRVVQRYVLVAQLEAVAVEQRLEVLQGGLDAHDQ